MKTKHVSRLTFSITLLSKESESLTRDDLLSIEPHSCVAYFNFIQCFQNCGTNREKKTFMIKQSEEPLSASFFLLSGLSLGRKIAKIESSK